MPLVKCLCLAGLSAALLAPTLRAAQPDPMHTKPDVPPKSRFHLYLLMQKLRR